jgi:hypothetical protein
MQKLINSLIVLLFLISPVHAGWYYSSPGGGAACSTSDESCTGSGDGNLGLGQFTGFAIFAAKFTSSGTDAICKITASTRDVNGDPDYNIRACIYTNNTTPDPDEPNTVAGTCSDWLSSGSFTASYVDVEFPNMNSGALSDATSYWVVLESSENADNANYYQWERVDSCSVESIFRSGDGASWTDVSQFRSAVYTVYH